MNISFCEKIEGERNKAIDRKREKKRKTEAFINSLFRERKEKTRTETDTDGLKTFIQINTDRLKDTFDTSTSSLGD